MLNKNILTMLINNTPEVFEKLVIDNIYMYF
jgi:hypothetical protein